MRETSSPAYCRMTRIRETSFPAYCRRTRMRETSFPAYCRMTRMRETSNSAYYRMTRNEGDFISKCCIQENQEKVYISFFLLEAVGPEQKRALLLPHAEYLTPFHGFFIISITRDYCTSFPQWVVLSSDSRWADGKGWNYQ